MKREKLIIRLDELNSQLSNLFEDLKRFSTDQLFQKPGPKVWSPIQVLYHLYKSEMLSLRYIKKKVQYDKNPATSGLLTFFRSVVLSLALQTPFKYRAAPPVDVEELPGGATMETIQKDWVNVREELRTFLLQIDTSYLSKNVYKHPLAGRFNLYQMLKFFNDHFQRHKKQIYDRLNAGTG